MIRDPFFSTQGIHNFRDYGGWQGAGGARVKTGLLFRSGQHVGATDSDLAAIGSLGIRTVIDLRGTSERVRNPCRRVEGWDGEVLFYEGETSSSPPHMDVDPTVTTGEFAKARMLAVYTRMPRNPAMIAMFGRYFRVLAEREGASLVHCFAGKDRTGIAATLLLHVLGVSEADQRAEFLRTNDARTMAVLAAQSVPAIEERLGRTLDEDARRALLGVEDAYLDRFLEIATEDHGSLDGWLTEAIGIDDKLRAGLAQRFLA